LCILKRDKSTPTGITLQIFHFTCFIGAGLFTKGKYPLICQLKTQAFLPVVDKPSPTLPLSPGGLSPAQASSPRFAAWPVSEGQHSRQGDQQVGWIWG